MMQSEFKIKAKDIPEIKSREASWEILSQSSEHMQYEKRLLPSCIHPFKPVIINNMDHMRISDNEPSSVILSHTK